MILEFDEEERLEIRRALDERADELVKLRKKNEEKGLFRGVADIDAHLRIINGNGNGEEPGLMIRLLNPDTDGAQRTIFDKTDNPPVEDSLHGIAEEAAARILKRQRAALKAALPALPEVEGDYAPSAEELLEMIADAWDDALEMFEGVAYDGLFRFEAELPLPVVSSVVGTVAVWCMLRGGPYPAFFYDVAAPDAFNPVDAIPTFEGEQLVREARRAYFETHDDEATVDEEEATGEDGALVTPAQYEINTRPTPENLDDMTGILLMGLHHALFLPEGAREAWYARAAEPTSDADLEGSIIAALQMIDDERREGNEIAFSLPIIDRESGNNEDYVAYLVTVDPPKIAIDARKKADRHELSGALLLSSVRSVLGIPPEASSDDAGGFDEMVEHLTSEDAPATIGAGAGLFGDDDE